MLRRESGRPKNGAVTCRVEAPERGEAGLLCTHSRQRLVFDQNKVEPS